MNRIDLTNLGGFPLEQDTLKFMQDGYSDMFSSIANLLGNKTILSGVQVIGGNVTDGWITYNGEIIKFVGAAAGGNVVIVETTNDATFEDATVRPVYKTRFATIGSVGAIQFPFSDLKLSNVGIPAGTVVMWSGSVLAIPAGWQLHAPLAGKFIVGYDPGDVDYNTIGNAGGEKKHQLTVNELPKHRPTGPLALNGAAAGANVYGRGGSLGSNWQGDEIGGDVAHENRPPYYTLAYIIKL